MKFSEFVKSVRAGGMKNMLLRGLFNVKVLDYDEVGRWAGRLGNRSRVDGITISMDNRLISEFFKGMIVLGQYEKDELEIIQKYLPKDEPVIELGASIGIVACIVNCGLNFPDQHLVVEANQELIPTLKKNRDVNHCQFEIVETAIGYAGPSITFFAEEVNVCGNIFYGSGQGVQVPATTLQSIAENAGFRHFNLISDIEGSEIDLIEHEIDFIREHVGLILMEIHSETPHGEEAVKLVIETLQQNGFEMLQSIAKFGSMNCCFRNTSPLLQTLSGISLDRRTMSE